MLMMKRSLYIIIILFLLAGITGGYFLLKRNASKNSSGVLEAIPIDAAVIIDIPRFSSFIQTLQQKSELWKELTSMKKVKDIDSVLSVIDSLGYQFEHLNQVLGSNGFLSAHPVGKDYFGIVFYSKLPSGTGGNEVLAEIESHVLKNGKLSQRKYETAVIHDIYIDKKTSLPDFSLTFINGLMIASPSGILLEEAIRQTHGEINIRQFDRFKKVASTSGKNVDANFYINLETFPDFMSLFLDNKYKDLVSSYTNIGSWTALDLDIKKDAIMLNGFTVTNDSAFDYLDIYLQQEPVEHTIETVVPSGVALFVSVGISNTGKYLSDYKKYLQQNAGSARYNAIIAELKQNFNTDLEKLLTDIFAGEAALVYTDLKNFHQGNNDFFLIKVHSQSHAIEAFEQLIEAAAEKSGRTKSSYMQTYKVDNEISFPIYEMPVGDLPGILFGEFFAGLENHYFTFINNFMVMGSDKEGLAKYIHFNVLNKTLANEIEFHQFSEYISAKSNFYLYTNVASSQFLLKKLFNDKIGTGIEKNQPTVDKLQAFAFQFSKANQLLFNNLFFKYTPEIREDPHTIWESLLDTAINFKPQLVENHYSKENEIFVQDLNNNIYLVNKVGRILWKQSIPEEIMSDVYQIDYYRNGKLQMLFSTRNYIYILDRNGNNVEKFPLKLRSPATTGIALFDYDNTKNYRIFVACENKKVYAYNQEGNIIPGWNFDKTEHQVNSPVQHFRFGNKDYIIFGDRNKTYILNRRGETRVNVDEPIHKSPQNRYYQGRKSGEYQFVTTDTAGIVHYISQSGKIEKIKITPLTSEHHFIFEDLDVDGKSDYIFLDGNLLQAFNTSGQPIFEYRFNHDIEKKPVYYTFSRDEIKIGITSTVDNQIYLFNPNGAVYKGFPLVGSTLFTIGFLNQPYSKFNLIVGSKDNFLYNYSVQ